MRKKRRTVEQLAGEWIEARKAEVKVTTMSTYSYSLFHYIVPLIGTCYLEELTTQRISEFVQELREKNLEARTVNGILRILKMMLRF